METLELCRLCALEKDNLLGIYDSEGIRLTLDEKIKKCLNIEVSERKNFPKSICLDCYSKLDAFEEFLESSINAQATLSILYPDKPEKISDLGLSDEDEKNDSEDGYGTHSESFILGNVGADDDLGMSGAGIMNTHDDTDKAYSDPPTNGLEHCSNSDVTADILSAVGQDFLQNNKPADVIGKMERSDSSEGRTDEERTVKKEEWDWPTNWLCSDCSEQFNNVGDLRQHHRVEHNQDARYMCDYCSKLFSEFNGFVNHMKRHKSSLKYNCDICGKVFSNKKHVDAHMHVHSNSRPFHCTECGKSFRQQSALLLHTRCHLPEEMKNWYPCEMCDKKFSTKPNLVTHMRIHTGIRNFTCDQCGKSFIQKGNLDAHLLTHSEDKPFECEVCHKRFKTTMQLRKHHTVHTGAKPHQCDVCGRNFREKGTLREHHRIHTGAMPFTCEFCGKAFRFKGILTTHRRQHTGERPYSCVECQHHFTNWPNYNKHMKRRHGINTSRTTRSENKFVPNQTTAVQQPQQQPQQQPPEEQTLEDSPPVSTPAQLYQEIQSTDLYANIQTSSLGSALPTYMAYNVYSLSNITTIDGTTIEIMPRQTLTLKEATGGPLNFQT